MKSTRFFKAVFAAGIVAACGAGMVACNGSGGVSGIAATVNGTEITEQQVADKVAKLREQSGLEDTDMWGKFLVQNEMTPESVRSDMIDTLVEQELIKEGAAELEISVEESEIDTYVESMKANYDTDEKWHNALEQAGFTEAEYRETLEQSALEQAVGDYFEDKAEVTDDDYLKSAQTYASYYDGAKRSSHILIGVEDTSDEEAMNDTTAKAYDIIDRINDGSLSFEDAAKEYSTDETSAENGGDVGWDKLNSFVTEYTDALSNLEKGQMTTDPVTSEYGVHIIKVTDVFNAPEEITSLDQIPADFQENIKDMAVSVKANSDYTDWLDGLKDSADIVINEMPSGLPYDIDLTPYQTEDETEGDGTDEATDEAGEVADDGTAVLDENGNPVDDATAEGAEAAEGTETAEADGANAEQPAEEGAEDAAADADESAASEEAGSSNE